MEKILDNHINIVGLKKTIYQDGNPLKILDGVDLY